jgi:hypothetical protein
MKKLIVFLLSIIAINLHGQNAKKEILLVGTFHFGNPGLDVAQVKTFDVMSPKSQQELENITNKIKQYNPDKIFVEWEYARQPELDSLYNAFLKGDYISFMKKKYPTRKSYEADELYQLAMKTAKKCKHATIYGIDYKDQSFPYDSMMTVIDKANQVSLNKAIEDDLREYEKTENADRAKLTLTQLLVKGNETKVRKLDLGAYISLFNQAGGKDNFVGAYLVSEWYKRNLYMYALLQKITESKDKKVMVLLGGSHIAMFKEFIELDSNFKAVELKEILK